MPLSPGTKLGHYEVVESVGKGGMGEVYRARDTKLGRDVAIKVLPEEFSRDKERLDRFEREARLLAQLNHPNIATLHGLEESDGQQFLVMELVEGETLAERIARGPIPIDEAIPLFIYIAEGLEAAHEKGIIHRDLKPANVKIGPDLKPKILDFGLAKALMGSDKPLPADASQSPTLTKGTALGAIMGTAAYMSPEQARGRVVDRRTDVWAFGCCLYEALTGKLAFTGDTVPDTLTAVLGKEPDWDALPKETPSRLRQLLARMLRKDARLRLQHVGDARIEFLDLSAEPSVDVPASSKPRYAVTLVTALTAALLTGVVVGRLSGTADVGDSQVVRMTILPPDGQQLVTPRRGGFASGLYPPVAISPDGQTVAFVARDGGPSRIYLRELDSLESRALDGTENADLPFFSHDGRWVGYLVGNVVSRVPVEGGVPLELGKVPGSARGAAWLSNETIVIGGSNLGLLKMDAERGTTERLTQPNNTRGEQYHAWPHVLPDGDHVLFTAVTDVGSDLGVVSMETGEWHLIEQAVGAAQPHYLASGHVVFFRSGGLFAAPFSLSRMAFESMPVQVAENVIQSRNAGLPLGFFAASLSGALVYVPGNLDLFQNHVVRVARLGEATRISEPGHYSGPVISPDGQRLAVGNVVRTSGDLWVLDLERGSRSRLTSENANTNPVWTADGQRVLFSLFGTGGSFDLYSVRADGGVPEALLERERTQSPTSASRDGRLVAFREVHPENRADIHILPLDGDTDPYPFLATPADERDARFSPDGRFLAYVSDETGRFEVYVQPLSGEGGREVISIDGGQWPRWSPQGDELFYRRGTAMMVVPVDLEPSFRAGTPELLFDGPYAQSFDVFPDGEHFAMVSIPQVELRDITVVVNWFAELERLVPTEN